MAIYAIIIESNLQYLYECELTLRPYVIILESNLQYLYECELSFTMRPNTTLPHIGQGLKCSLDVKPLRYFLPQDLNHLLD